MVSRGLPGVQVFELGGSDTAHRPAAPLELRRRGLLAVPPGTGSLFSVQFMNPAGASGAPRHSLMFHFAGKEPFGRGAPGGGGSPPASSSAGESVDSAADAGQLDDMYATGDGGSKGTVGEEPEQQPDEEAPDAMLLRQLWEAAEVSDGE